MGQVNRVSAKNATIMKGNHSICVIWTNVHLFQLIYPVVGGWVAIKCTFGVI